MDSEKERKKKEDGWFHEHEKKLLAKLREERQLRMAEATSKLDKKRQEDLKKAHWMCCPKCGNGMATKDFRGVSVEVCTLCEGVFFDRGELEDLLDKEFEARRNFFYDLLGLS